MSSTPAEAVASSSSCRSSINDHPDCKLQTCFEIVVMMQAAALGESVHTTCSHRQPFQHQQEPLQECRRQRRKGGWAGQGGGQRRSCLCRSCCARGLSCSSLRNKGKGSSGTAATAKCTGLVLGCTCYCSVGCSVGSQWQSAAVYVNREQAWLHCIHKFGDASEMVPIRCR